MTSGIYVIRNTATGKRYVGASLNVEARWQMHTRDLNENKHTNKRLGQDWRLYGADAFEFTLIEEIPDGDKAHIAERENYHIERLRPSGIYNNAGRGGFAVREYAPRVGPVKPRTFTMSENDLLMLAQLIQWRHASDPKAASITVRECIRNEYAREKAARNA